MDYGEFVAFRVSAAQLRLEAQQSAQKGTKQAIRKGGITRVRRFTRRSRNGCIICKERKVKCDERREGGCKRCERGGLQCIYAYPCPVDVAANSIASQAFVAPSGPFTGPEELDDMSFWTETAGITMGSWHCPYFWRILVPQASWMHDSVKYSLLAVSTCVRQWYVAKDEDRENAVDRGLQYYRMACQAILKPLDNTKSTMEAILTTSLVLFCFDSFTDNKLRRYVHSNASIRLLKALKDSLSFTVISAAESPGKNVAAYPIIDTSDTSFYDISYLTHKPNSSHTDGCEPPAQDCRKIYTPMWFVQNEDGNMTMAKMSPTDSEAPPSDYTQAEASLARDSRCQQHLSAWHCWLVTWITTIATDVPEIRRRQLSVRKWHSWLLDTVGPRTSEEEAMHNRALIIDEVFSTRVSNDEHSANQHLDAILRLTKRNLDLSKPVASPANVQSLRDVSGSNGWNSANSEAPALNKGLPYMKGLLTTLEYVVRRTTNANIKLRAYKLMTLQC